MPSYTKYIFKYLILYLIGCSVYSIVELLYDGSTHYTMFILGGICFILGGLLNEIFSWEMTLFFQGIIIGVFIITPLELLFGLLFNSDYSIWDYRHFIFNFKGQISLVFTMIWCVIGVLIVVIDDYLRYYIFKEQKPKYKII